MAWNLSTEIAPNYNGGLMRAKWLIGGVRTVKTLAQRNALPALYRYFSAEESTIVFVEDESQLYRLNNNPVGTTGNSDWSLITFGNISSALTPIGTWNINNTEPELTDEIASGKNGNFYFVTGAPTPEELTITGLFTGEPVTVVDGNMIISVGTRWVVVANSTAWNSIDKPQSIIDYVAGTVIAHSHTTSDISDLGTYLADYLTNNDIADSEIDFDAVPDTDLITTAFVKKYYYRKSEIDDLLSSFSSTFLELSDTPSSYSGYGLKLVQVNAAENALEFIDPPATDLTSVLTKGNDAGGLEIINLGLGTEPASALRRADVLDTTGKLLNAIIPASIMERIYVYGGAAVLPEDAGLTITEIQNGDVVKINSTGLMYAVVDDTLLNSALGYTVFSMGAAATVPWSGVEDVPTTLAGYGISDAWKISGTTVLAGNTTIDATAYQLRFNTPNFIVGNGTSTGDSNVNFGLDTILSGSWSLTIAEASTIRGSNSLSSGWSHEVGDGTGFSGNGSFTFGTDNKNFGLSSYLGGIGGKILYMGNSQRGGFVHAFQAGSVDGLKPSTVEYLLANDGAGNISRNTSAQTVGHGALALDSFILGGIDHNIPSDSPRSVIIGGNAIKARASDPDNLYVPYLNITQIAQDDSLTQVLVRNSTTGKLHYKAVSSFGGGGITNSATAGQIPYTDSDGNLAGHPDFTFSITSLTTPTHKIFSNKYSGTILGTNAGEYVALRQQNFNGHLNKKNSHVEVYHAAGQTTNSSPVAWFSYRSPVGLSSTCSFTVDATILARRSGGTAGVAGDSAAYNLKALFKCEGATMTQIGTTAVTVIGESQAGWNVETATGSFSGVGYMSIRVIGADNNTIDWNMEVTIMRLE